jgi:hypothetical protein
MDSLIAFFITKAYGQGPLIAAYGGGGSQTGTDPTGGIREGADRRGMHDNFGKETHDNIGRFDPPVNIVSTDYSLADSIAIGAEVLTEVAIGLSTAFLIWGALRFALAAGDEERVDHAKAIMKWAVMGLVVSLVAFGMVRLVSNTVMSA